MMMDRLEQLIEAFRAEPAARVYRKLDVLMDLERLRDPRSIPFLLQVVQDDREPLEVRTRVVRLLRAGRCPESRTAVGQALSELLTNPGSPDLRVAAALTLAEFTEVEGVPASLGAVALDATEPLDLRYCAFTSLERAGKTPEGARLLRRIALDDALGPSARSLLARWQLS
jgi:hypothetical protein